ncbi:uroplakin-3a isoform X2 [Hippopotamus amphibius kiboko]|uniref:uroplakin-3a isoform X2 n=1 Tax=Hippopotamus amphibius kiboko TaxID=575201 RepID=UPI002594EF72|nr:uroplakin-3a isoform X2 [Hippopotamus amphibius kiboko]
MPPLWILLALGCMRLGSGVNLQPQLASVSFATNNPTLTTVALEKPLCMFDSSAPLPGAYEVYLYVLVDSAAPHAAIDTWPGRRSGGMIVVTSILGSLPFFLLLSFAGAIALSLVDMGGADRETAHDTRITQEADPKSLGTSDTLYTSVKRGPSLDRAEVYASKLQD